MRDRHWCQSFSSYVKDLKLSTFLIFGPLIKHIFLAHELKMRFKLLNFARKLFLMLKGPPPLLWKIYLYENFLFILHYKYPDNLYLSKIHEMNGFVKLRAVSKLSTFFIYPSHRIKIHIEGPLTSEALKFLSSRMSHYACWPPSS
jgi:hypothetical protein